MTRITILIKQLNYKFLSTLSSTIIAVFLISGSLFGFLSAFDIHCDFVLVLFCFFIAAIFLNINLTLSSIRRLLCYFVYFVVYFFGVSTFGNYINTGFYYILNEVITVFSDYVGATNAQEYRLLVSDTMNAVTIFTIFIGLFLLIPLVSAVSRKMSIWSALFYTFPMIALPCYLHLDISILWSGFLISGYFILLSFRCLKQKKQDLLASVSHTGKMLYSCSVLGFVLIFSCFFHILFPNSLYQAGYEEPDFKTAGYEKAATLLQFGLSGFFNNYSGAGGMAGGVLGGIYAIQPDYETDLIVEFSPFNTDTLYLRGYTGTIYEDNRWLCVEDLTDFDFQEIDDSLLKETLQLKEDFENQLPNASKELIRVRNVGASSLYSYVPYYSDEASTIAGYDAYADYTVYPYHETKNNRQLSKKEWDFYCSVPEKNSDILENFCKEHKLSGDANTVIQKIQTLFAEEYTYTMQPGKTPAKADFVTHFLTKSKKGYCAHFASSAVLLLRTLNIPARYVEGYALPASALTDGTLQKNKNPNDYHEGYRELDSLGVLRCEINDSQAHAWVEYYDENFGWRTLEFTPPGTEEEITSSSLFSSLANFFRQQSDTPAFSITQAQKENDTAQNNTPAFELLQKSKVYVLLLIMLVSILCFLLYYKKYFLCHTTEKLITVYGITCDKIRKKQPDFSTCRSHSEQLLFIKAHYLKRKTWDKMDFKKLSDYLEKISYQNLSVHKMTADEKELANALCLILWISRLKS